MIPKFRYNVWRWYDWHQLNKISDKIVSEPVKPELFHPIIRYIDMDCTYNNNCSDTSLYYYNHT